MHRWGASVFIILMFMHMARVFLFGAYKYPRELNWIVGVLLLALGHVRGLHRLPAALGPDGLLGDGRRDQHQRHGAVPRAVHRVAPPRRGRDRPDTLSRFYSLHMLLIPGALIGLIGLHLYLVVRLGVTSPPWSKEAAGSEPRPEPPPARGARPRPARPRGGVEEADCSDARLDERRAEFKRYKEDVKKRGKPFYPYAMFHDTVMSLVVVLRDHRARLRLEVHGPRATDRSAGSGSSTTTRPTRDDNFVPRPDWYFYFLFYLLRIFKWPDTVILGTVGIPTICLILLLALPFVDLRRERRLLAAAGRDRRGGARRPLDGRPHVQGRDREGGARERGSRPRSRAGSSSRASQTTSRRSPARTSSPSPAA